MRLNAASLRDVVDHFLGDFFVKFAEDHGDFAGDWQDLVSKVLYDGCAVNLAASRIEPAFQKGDNCPVHDASLIFQGFLKHR